MATNRLRKRLDEADDRTKSRVNESFCTIGTPLPSLDSKRDANEYKPEWQQEVYDDQGRRRFHGAFTGGFSAGYYNTVGSKEGWTPGTFRSSRKEKQKDRSDGGQESGERRRVEDFMDEEDLEDMRQGRGALQSSEDYGGKARAAPIERDPLLSMFGLAQPSEAVAGGSDSSGIQKTTAERIGTKILQQMGWKPGRGLGPLVSPKRRRELEVSIGLAPNAGDDDEAKANELVAPPDTQLVKPAHRQELRGLGWEGQGRPQTLAEALQRERSTHATGLRKGGFGIGALEQDSDGEEEVYAVGHQMEHSTMAQKRRKATKDAEQVRTTSSDKENKWHDGRPMLAGFQIALRPPAQERWYAAPRPPPGWKPDPQRVWTQAAATTATKVGSTAANLCPTQRASMLGEARIPGPPPMITDYLSLKARKRIERAKAAIDEAASTAGAAEPAPLVAQRSVATLDVLTAKAALQGYMPFENEPAKQQRYRNYLRSQAEPQASIKLSPFEGQTEEQFHRESNEFSRSAAIFKPLSTVMASRFESSVSGSTHLQPLAPGLHIPDPKALSSQGERDPSSAAAKQKRLDDERAQGELKGLSAVRRNAKMGLFGPETTREIKTWKPARLLCKRFNVPLPYPLDEEESEEKAEAGAQPAGEDFDAFGESSGKRVGGNAAGGVNARWEASKRQLQHLAASRAWEGHDNGVRQGAGSDRLVRPEDKEAVGEITKKTDRASNDLANVGLGGDDEEREETTYVKAPLDLFKAIFADDDVESEERSGQTANKADDAVHHASPLPSEPTRIASDATLPRPTFVPRKRPGATADLGERPPRYQDGDTKTSHKKAKQKGRSLLTFALDDEEDEASDEIIIRKPPRQRQGDTPVTPSSMPTKRPRASDLFD